MTAQNTTHTSADVRASIPWFKWTRSGVPLFTAAVIAMIVLGWQHRHENVLRPERGAGYALGIVGALMMLALLLYPLRKRVKLMRAWGRTADWFRWHMALGVLGPALVVLHSNFQIQSANAAVAFVSMLVVSASGVVGRYLYGRIHAGLYGRKREAKELLAECAADREALGLDLSPGSRAGDVLAAFENQALAPTPSLGAALVRFAGIGGMIRRSRRDLWTQIERRAGTPGRGARSEAERLRTARRRLSHYYAAVRRAATFGLYERLFALWHVLHIPLFVILLCTAIIHVVAVHLY